MYDYTIEIKTKIEENEDLDTSIFRYFNTLEEAINAYELLSSFATHDNVTLSLLGENDKLIKSIVLTADEEVTK